MPLKLQKNSLSSAGYQKSANTKYYSQQFVGIKTGKFFFFNRPKFIICVIFFVACYFF